MNSSVITNDYLEFLPFKGGFPLHVILSFYVRQNMLIIQELRSDLFCFVLVFYCVVCWFVVFFVGFSCLLLLFIHLSFLSLFQIKSQVVNGGRWRKTKGVEQKT